LHWLFVLHSAPTGSSSVHAAALPQYSLDVQSASLLQPLLHTLLAELQPPMRHWSESSQGPSLGARPHLPSTGSQTPDWQMARPIGAVQVATRSGSFGNGVPLASFGRHMPSFSLHHLPLGHSLSSWQPLSHKPPLGSQTVPT
jgi:hypothetical protein